MNRKQKAAAAAVAVAAAAGMVTGTVIESPVELAADVLPVSDVQQVEDDAAINQEERQKGIAARIRAWILGLPAAVRILVGIPLWCIGWLLTTALSTFWLGMMSPLAARVLAWLCLAAVLLLVFGVSVKAAFPALRLKEIFRPLNLFLLLGMTAFLLVADMALPTVWEGYNLLSQTVWRIGASCLLAFCCCAELKHQGKRAEAKARAASPRTEVELTARALADSVCPPRY